MGKISGFRFRTARLGWANRLQRLLLVRDEVLRLREAGGAQEEAWRRTRGVCYAGRLEAERDATTLLVAEGQRAAAHFAQQLRRHEGSAQLLKRQGRLNT